MLSLKNLTKSFGSVRAVNGLSFDVGAGEIVGLLGPNGAGKTTTMRLITGFLAPDAGDAIFDGLSVRDNAIEVQRHIGYLPESNPLYKDMLVSEFLNFSLELKGVAKDDCRGMLDFSVSATGIADVFYRPIGDLSKGYKQRVGLAAALLARPRLLIMDEPTEGLDPNQRAEIRALIKNIGRERTVIMSTHVMQEAAAVATRLIIVNQGVLVADGTPDELQRRSRRERILELDVEGENAGFALRSLPGVEHADIEERGGRIRATITASDQTPLQPDISRLARERGWIIWRLAEKEHTLEDVFHKLTSET
ncbi:MAG: ATP-binding cassette domain-containing protein [Patescibacteria group bacterium]